MSISQLLFSFQGRVNRAKWWLVGLAVLAFMIVLVVIGVLLAASLGAAAAVLFLFYIPILWIGLAMGAKRLHDRDKSAWWLVLFYLVPGILQGIAGQAGSLSVILMVISAAITVWAIVELGFLRGTTGANQYGPDPLQA